VVTAQTFKDTIERTLSPRMQSGWAADLADIVGARAYIALYLLWHQRKTGADRLSVADLSLIGPQLSSQSLVGAR
jgi:hypothetical protein